jgi:hypothetical protein
VQKMSNEKYTMTISRNTVDKLGIKLYDKAAAVVVELIANAYDADAELVTVRIPLNRALAKKVDGKLVDQGLEISVEDDGHGIAAELVNDFYLKVGTNPRIDKRRGPTSLEKHRPIMGRKGIGKLAPFGICNTIDVRFAGGEETALGYKVSHFIMNYDEIDTETDAPYHPEIGIDDGKYSKKRGTIIRLRSFLRRRTPDEETFHRQVSRKFGLQLPDFKIKVVNTENNHEFIVGELPVEIDEETKIDLSNRPVRLEDGTELPVRGWVAYAKNPYANFEMAGVRIYARGKFAAVTRDFNLGAGFTGEFTIRSYLVGVIHADWLDADDGEDLIRSDRQDILWDSEIGLAFQDWGQAIIKELGKTSWSPRKQRFWKTFLTKSDLENEARRRYGDEEIVDKAVKLGRVIGRGFDQEDVEDNDYVKGISEVVLAAAPHLLQIDSLREIEEMSAERPLQAIIKIFRRAKIGERASLGLVVEERIDAIRRLEEKLPAEEDTAELELQKLLEDSPWIINPQWTMLSANQTFETMRKAFEMWYKDKYGTAIKTTSLAGSDRPDFVMLHVGRNIEICEIKKKGHCLTDAEFDKILGYYNSLDTFLSENKSLKDLFPKPHITLVCDDIDRLDAAHKEAYLRKEEKLDLVRKTWHELLTDTKKVHEEFLALSKYSTSS